MKELQGTKEKLQKQPVCAARENGSRARGGRDLK